jgi:hypothetical protein
MNCTAWEERIALHAGGDLPAGEAVEVERHLGECAGCQVLWSGLRESLDTLRAAHQAHQDTLGPAHFTRSTDGCRRSWSGGGGAVGMGLGRRFGRGGSGGGALVWRCGRGGRRLRRRSP